MNRCLVRLTYLVTLLICLMYSKLSLADSELTVFTTNYPLYYFANRIAAGQADVNFPAPEDIDPVFWNPDVETIGHYQQADYIFLNGAGYEKWTGYAFLPSSRMIDTSRSFSDRILITDDSVSHSHGLDGDHSHGGKAWTTWLDFDLAQRQASVILDTLLKAIPHSKVIFENSHTELKQQLTALDQAMKNAVNKMENKAVLASHPVYQYLGQRYGLDITSVTWEPHSDPGEEQWELLTELVTRQNLDLMLWEGQPLAITESRLNKLGIRVVVFNPAGNFTQSSDWLAVMNNNIDNLNKTAHE